MSTSNKICKDGASSKSEDDDVCEVKDTLQNMSVDESNDIITADIKDDDSVECSLCGWGQTKKICTSCEQKLQQAKNEECTSCEQIDKITEGIENVAVHDDVPKCASCGKKGNDSDMNTCNKCKMVKYCNAACKKKHRKKHKKACERRVAELHDEKLFKVPPPKEDCPICFLRMPSLYTGKKYKACCGKEICSGCIYTVKLRAKDLIGLCPFCRVPGPSTDEELIERTKSRVNTGDSRGMYNMGFYYTQGQHGLPQDRTKTLELWRQAGELGCTDAYHNLGHAYYTGDGVERDEKMARYYWELAAMDGDTDSRHCLGNLEINAFNVDRAMKHYMISVSNGSKESSESIQRLHSSGFVTKDDHSKALIAYQSYLVEIKSKQRDEAAAYGDEYKYY